jgi:hypothetical protein
VYPDVMTPTCLVGMGVAVALIVALWFTLDALDHLRRPRT